MDSFGFISTPQLNPIFHVSFYLFFKYAGHEKAYVLISRCFLFFCPFFPMSLRQDIPSALFPAFALIAFIISHLTTAFSDLLVSLLCWTKWKVAG